MLLNNVFSVSGVSDKTISPGPFFGGSSSNSDAEEWLEVFKRYCSHRKLPPRDELTLFGLVMREGAADWLSTLTDEKAADYNSLCNTAYKENYSQPAEPLNRPT